MRTALGIPRDFRKAKIGDLGIPRDSRKRMSPRILGVSKKGILGALGFPKKESWGPWDPLLLFHFDWRGPLSSLDMFFAFLAHRERVYANWGLSF